MAVGAEPWVVVATWRLYRPCATPCPPASTMKGAIAPARGSSPFAWKATGPAKVQGRCRTVGPYKADVMAW